MDVLLQATIENMLQQTGETVVVFRSNDHDSVGLCHRLRELRPHDSLAGVIDGNLHLGDIDELRGHTLELLQLAYNEPCGVSTHPAVTGRAQNYRNRDGATVGHIA